MSEGSKAMVPHAVNDAAPVYPADTADAVPDDVPLGYKRAEVGVIPGDWCLAQLKDLVEFLDSQRKPVKSSERAKMAGIYPYYGASGVVDYVNDYLFDEELILLGEDGENILSRNLPLAFRVSGKIWVNNHAHVLRPNGKADIGFLTNFLEVQDYQERNSGTAQPKLNRATCASIPVALPTIQEQRAIANALSDADALIKSLDRLVTKKRAIKQAAMQQLLTGETRLPGFEGAWQDVSVGDIAEVRCGGTPSTTRQEFWNGGVPWCTPTDITALLGSKYLKDTERTISHKGLQVSSAEIIPPNSIIVTTRATIGECAINTVPMSTNQGFKNLVPVNTESEFLYYLMSIQKERLLQLCSGSTFLEVGKKQLERFEVTVPTEIAEQKAIATVLAELDAEIYDLERRRGKARQIRQGMMQQLLSGRVRLVKPLPIRNQYAE